MKKIVLFLLFLLCGCASTNNLAERPFIIVEKVYYYTNKQVVEYVFEDRYYRKFKFYSFEKDLEIGDTLK